MLQLMMLAGGVTTLTVVARNALIRRDDIRTRFELEQAHDRMEQLSLKDPLTGVWNRRFLDQQFGLIREKAAASGQGLQFALIDIDDFKALNDSCGHDFGDLVLCQLAESFQREMGKNDCLVRLGGDEFLLLMTQQDTLERIRRAVQHLRQDPRMRQCKEDCRLSVGISAGLVLDDGRRRSLDELYQAADKALYQSKAAKEKRDGDFICIHSDSGADR
jgi:diguanylate cyclase (GGDEF)-like protein